MKYEEVLLNLAKKASSKDEVPVSAIIVKNDKIIAKSYNKREKNNDILGHAEILCIKKANKRLKKWKLNDCIMYVTLKPCSICENIIKQSRIKKVYYLLDKNELKKEYNKTEFNLIDNIELKDKYSKILSDFFKKKR